MSIGITTVAYIGASILFILSLGGLSNQETARRGNIYGIIGMAIAIVATILATQIDDYTMLIAAVIVGALIGIVVASRVEMTQMPQLVAILHSFVGLAAVLVGIASYVDPNSAYEGVEKTIHEVEIFLGVFIGAVTFTGSVIAFGKLQGSISGKPMLLPARHWLNLAGIVGSLWLGYEFLMSADHSAGLTPLLIMTAIACLIGIHLVMAIGGADMPVVVSMLNSYSGWAAAATGFMLANDLLIVVGALVGSSGAILSYIMCRAMNRHFVSVILGGFGTSGGTAATDAEQGEVVPTSVDETAAMLADANEVIIVPGYGMAVSQSQHVVKEFAELLAQKYDTEVKYAIHPVAGRMPGHMNVLLAEANVPYEQMVEMDDINSEFPECDVALVIGANDTCNPAAREDTGPLAGMPIINVDQAQHVVVVKRSLGVGYAGVDNDIFYMNKTMMLFGDAKTMMGQLNKALAES